MDTGDWFMIPHSRPLKKREDAGTRDILDDGVIAGEATVRSESASESGEFEEPRWNVSHEDDMTQLAVDDIAGSSCQL